jgi:hypothetical protein
MPVSMRPPSFRGSYKQRNVSRTAPDAFVKINGHVNLAQCSGCDKVFDINPYISSISTDLNIDSVPGSATIQLAIPRHDINNFYADGKFIIQEMMEVEIFIKGHFLVYGVPQYYPVFWGLVTQINEGFSSGENTVSLSCADILKWWEKTRLNVNPSWYEAGMTKFGNIALFGNMFAGSNPYDVIFSLNRNISGDMFVGLQSLSATEPDFFKQSGKLAIASIMAYWRQRFARLKNSLVLYGMNGTNISASALNDVEDSLSKKIDSTKNKAIRNVLLNKYKTLASDSLHKLKDENGNSFLDPTAPNIVGFKKLFSQAGNVNLFESEYMSKLEIANTVKDVINYEFYMDTTGDIVFKPPFWNLDVSDNPISVIKDIDIIDWDLNASEAEVVTSLTMKGSFRSNAEYSGIPSEIIPTAVVTDYKLMSQFGWRTHDYSSEWLTDARSLFFHGLDVLDNINARRFSGSITIPIRAELRLGFPIYLEERDEFWYVQGISHNFTFGSRATTQLTLTQRRSKFVPPENFLKSLDNTGYYNESSNKGVVSNPARDPETGKLKGHPNIIMVYSKGSKDMTDNDFRSMSSGVQTDKTQKEASKEAAKKAAEAKKRTSDKVMVDQVRGLTAATEEMSNVNDALNFIYSYGNTGLSEYTYAKATQEVIKAGALSEASIDLVETGRGTDGKPKKNASKEKGLKIVFPVSDSRGYEHIGNYAYGRGLTINGGGIKKVSDGITSQSKQNSFNGATVVSQNKSAESFATMSPSSEKNNDPVYDNEGSGTQKISTNTVRDPMNVEVDSLMRGNSMAALYPTSDTAVCKCSVSRTNLNIVKLLKERGVVGETNVENIDLDKVFERLYEKDFSSYDDHAHYEEVLRGGK